MPYAELTAALAVIAYIELRVERELRRTARQLERDYKDNGGRRRQEARDVADTFERRRERSVRERSP
jgi:hypothetical protein